MEKEKIDYVIAVGPMPMMKAVAELTRGTGIKTEASMNPIMVDGTGMCGACRLTVGGKVKFACVDGPDFDAHEIDFDEVINRSKIYKAEERRRHENCNLMKK
jgi:ferredoxin--NADP+ reductase